MRPVRYCSAAWTMSLACWCCVTLAQATDDVVTFPLSPYQGDVPLLPVTVDGAEHLFLLDSGAFLHCFDSDFRPSLGELVDTTSVTQGDGSKVNTEVFKQPVAAVGSFMLGIEAPVLCIDLTTPREGFGRNIKGILGMPFFAAHVIQLDFEKNEIRILPGDAEPQEEWGESVPVAYATSNRPMIFARVAGWSEDEPFLADSGYNGSLSLRSDLFSYLVQEKTIAVTHDGHTALANKVVKESFGRLSAFTLADYAHQDLAVSGGDQMSRLGLAYFRRYLVTFDLGRCRLFLKPNANYHHPDLTPALGISLLRKAGKTLIMALDDKKPAAKAGLQVGDELLSIAGVPITSQSFGELGELFRSEVAPNGDLPLLVEQQGKTRSIMVRNLEPPVEP